MGFYLTFASIKLLKIIIDRHLFLAPNTLKYVWRPGSARTRWGSLSAPPDALAAVGALEGNAL